MKSLTARTLFPFRTDISVYDFSIYGVLYLVTYVLRHYTFCIATDKLLHYLRFFQFFLLNSHTLS